MGQATTLAKTGAYLFPLMLALVVLGFWPSYFAALTSTRFSLHVHSFLMFSYMGALIAQALLVRARRMDWHRRIGKASFVIAPLMILVGFVVQREFFADAARPFSAEVLQNLTLSFFAITNFAILYALAICYRREPSLHARYMISTGVILMDAGVLRVFLFWVPGVFTLESAANAMFIFIEIFTLALMANDLRLGRLRTPFAVTLALIAVNHVLFWTAAEMAWWKTLARWVLG